MAVRPTPDPAPHAELQFESFENLMPFRVNDILLVSSLYDSFILREDGRLNELLMGESLELDIHQVPGITHVPSGAKALELARSQPRFNLIVTNLQVGRHGCRAIGARSQGRRSRCSGHRSGLRLPRDQELHRAQSADRYRAHISVARQCPHPDLDRQVHRRQAQRPARHSRHERPRDAGGGGRYPLLLPLPAGDLHRTHQPIAPPAQRRPQCRAQAGAHARPSQDPAVFQLRGRREAGHEDIAITCSGVVSDVEFPRDHACSRRKPASSWRA